MPLPSTRNVPSVPVVVPTVAGPTAAATADDTALPALDPLLDAADAAELTLVDAADAAELTLVDAADAAELTLLDAADAGELATAEVVDVDPELHAAASNQMANMAPVSRQAVDQRFPAPIMVTPFVDARAPFGSRASTKGVTMLVARNRWSTACRLSGAMLAIGLLAAACSSGSTSTTSAVASSLASAASSKVSSAASAASTKVSSAASAASSKGSSAG